MDGALDRYRKTRLLKDRPVCQAPFNSMYFNVFGEVGPCWLNLHSMGRYPENSIRDIWFGEPFNELRKALKRQNLEFKCGQCLDNIRNDNHHSVLAKLYDYQYELQEYPSVMEFELSNRCNLECVMCKGDLSSTIRKNREQRHPLVSPYDNDFVQQLEEFIPHLKEAKFLGGEPFLIEQYFSIWQKMVELNPTIKITVTTNGTVFNSRIASLLSSLRFNVIVSIDAFNESRYEEIRKRAVYNRVIQNLHWFHDYTKQEGTYFQVSMNPLRKNRFELSNYVDYCNQHGMNLWFNTVVYPHSETLKTLSSKKLQETYDHLRKHVFQIRTNRCTKEVFKNNIVTFNNFVENQLKVWIRVQEKEEENRCQNAQNMTTMELIESLGSEMNDYIVHDAYLTDNQKTNRISLVQERILSLNGMSPKEVKSLYLQNRSEIAEVWF